MEDFLKSKQIWLVVAGLVLTVIIIAQSRKGSGGTTAVYDASGANASIAGAASATNQARIAAQSSLVHDLFSYNLGTQTLTSQEHIAQINADAAVQEAQYQAQNQSTLATAALQAQQISAQYAAQGQAAQANAIIAAAQAQAQAQAHAANSQGLFGILGQGLGIFGQWLNAQWGH